jgi:hypothetical protein
MVRLFLVAVVMAGCGAPSPASPCGIEVAAPGPLTDDDLQSQVRRALDGATFTTDPTLVDRTANCRAMEGFTVAVVSTPSFIDEGDEVFGVTRCWQKSMRIGTPPSGSWETSSLAHELFHVMQRCSTPQPIDEGEDAHHSNWKRDLIYFGIGKGKDRGPSN